MCNWEDKWGGNGCTKMMPDLTAKSRQLPTLHSNLAIEAALSLADHSLIVTVGYEDEELAAVALVQQRARHVWVKLAVALGVFNYLCL